MAMERQNGTGGSAGRSRSVGRKDVPTMEKLTLRPITSRDARTP